MVEFSYIDKRTSLLPCVAAAKSFIAQAQAEIDCPSSICFWHENVNLCQYFKTFLIGSDAEANIR